jgi:hypothetical protein
MPTSSTGTLQRLCVSPISMLTPDFKPSITLQNGDLVFLGPYLQYFSNCQSLTIKWILENRSKNPGIEPGDMFLSNYPYVGSPHQPDVVVAAPEFVLSPLGGASGRPLRLVHVGEPLAPGRVPMGVFEVHMCDAHVFGKAEHPRQPPGNRSCHVHDHRHLPMNLQQR